MAPARTSARGALLRHSTRSDTLTRDLPLLKALAIFSRTLTRGSCLPRSRFAIYTRCTPALSASACCDQPRSFLSRAIRFAIFLSGGMVAVRLQRVNRRPEDDHRRGEGRAGGGPAESQPAAPVAHLALGGVV